MSQPMLVNANRSRSTVSEHRGSIEGLILRLVNAKHGSALYNFLLNLLVVDEGAPGLDSRTLRVCTQVTDLGY